MRGAPQPQSTLAPPKEVLNWRVYILSLVASMGAFLFGYDLAFIGTAITLKPFEKLGPPNTRSPPLAQIYYISSHLRHLPLKYLAFN